MANSTFFTSETVTEFSGDNNGVNMIKTDKGKALDTDMVCICAGVTPNVEIAVEAGVALGSTGAIKVNKKWKQMFLIFMPVVTVLKKIF